MAGPILEAVGVGLLLVFSLLPAGVSAAETAPTSKVKTQDEHTSEPPEEPAESERRRLRELLYGATPEERARLAEERKRLSEAAAARPLS